MENRIIGLLKILREKNEISHETYNMLYPVGSKPGNLHGLTKIHKLVTDNIPYFCPILSAIDTRTYKLGKVFVPLLEPLTNDQYTIRDSFCFSEELKHFDLSLTMASFDAESLFTDISLQETIDLCVENLLNNKEYFHDTPKTFSLQLLTLTMNESFI